MQNSHKCHLSCSGAVYMQVSLAISNKILCCFGAICNLEISDFTEGCCVRGFPVHC